MLRATQSKLAKSRAGSLIAPRAEAFGRGVHSARVAFGATRPGAVLRKLQAPLAATGTAVTAANVFDEARRFATDDPKASPRGLVLSVLGLVPAVGTLGKTVNARRAARTGRAASATVVEALPQVRAAASTAAREVDRLASAGPTLAAQVPAVRVTASRVADRAATVERGAQWRLAAGRRELGSVDDLRSLKSEVDAVATDARIASQTIGVTRGPTHQPVSVGQVEDVAEQLDSAAVVAARVSQRLDRHLAKRVTLERRIGAATALEQHAGATATSSGLANNAWVAFDTTRPTERQASVEGIARTWLGLMLSRNGRRYASSSAA